MSKPVILALDDDRGALQGVERELVGRYANDYRVMCADSRDEALAILGRLRRAGDEVALVLAGQWLSTTTGSEMLDRVRELHPHAKRGLLVTWGDWGDRRTAEAIFDSMALGVIDYYVLRPAGAPDEVFHQAISGFLAEWSRARRSAPHATWVVADSWSGRAYELRRVLERCATPHAFCLADSEEGSALVARAGRDARLPFLVLPDGRILADPTNVEIAQATGAAVDPEHEDFDVVVVGAGPAGLSAAVYGASEGLDTLVVDEGGVGGQATSSSLIRNYLGFPRGVGGGRLAEQAYEQAWVFGSSFAFMQTASGVRREGQRLVVTLSHGREVTARAVILATGATYRRVDVPALEALVGAGVSYGGPVSEASGLAGKDVYIVGGANSAGQAALHLARHARRVTLVVRAQSLHAGMSHYLVREVLATPNVEVRVGTAVVGGGGDARLEHLTLRQAASGDQETVPADALFVLIGARPHTDWLPDEVARDRRGFVLTGADLPDDGAWPLDRRPHLLETSMPGVLAAGDVRHGSVKRVASAVGEGAIAIQVVHGLFAAEGLGRARPVPTDAGAASPQRATAS
jgi:thioredoxin reductase (NADPH)